MFIPRGCFRIHTVRVCSLGRVRAFRDGLVEGSMADGGRVLRWVFVFFSGLFVFTGCSPELCHSTPDSQYLQSYSKQQSFLVVQGTSGKY